MTEGGPRTASNNNFCCGKIFLRRRNLKFIKNFLEIKIRFSKFENLNVSTLGRSCIFPFAPPHVILGVDAISSYALMYILFFQ